MRFVEVVVNGPKSWSLAAALSPDIAAAYDAAQDRAAQQIIGWLAEHATTRMGARGAQVQVPVQELQAVTVRHYTSRAGDPHRHLHLQINARVLAEDSWRGLHTVGVRDSLDAINGIGHAAVISDPQLRAALAQNGFSLDPATGEVRELSAFIGPFSARAEQIGRNIDRYEAEWRLANPAGEPGPRLLRAWDARAWADARPDKIHPQDGAELNRRWLEELHELGYRDRRRPVALHASPVGALDRDSAVRAVLTRLGARRSAWNCADIRGEVEQLIARTGIIAAGPVRIELAEDLTARTLAQCVSLLERPGVPEHVRTLTSQRVLDVEADLVTSLTQRAASAVGEAIEEQLARAHVPDSLDRGQRHAVHALSHGGRLVVVEGAAGAGKTTTLAAARTAVERQGHRMMVVTPTLKAARVAAEQLGASTSSAAWLIYQYGHRWDNDGTWRRLRVGDTDPVTGVVYSGPSTAAVLAPGDLLLVDEAGMLDQDTAHALLCLADELDARLALIGDRYQLPAVGRGGVVDLAARVATSEASITLDTVHRFAQPHYAEISLAMRTGERPEVVFDMLLDRGHIQIYPHDLLRTQAVAESAVATIIAGQPLVVAVDTREQAARLNAVIRDQLLAAGRVDDTRVVTTHAGERLGVGDVVSTRRNDRDLDVANRDSWTLTAVHRDGGVTLTGQRGERILPAPYVRQHLELAYANTVHAVQGTTTDIAHFVLGEHTAAAAAYVALTRGRHANTAHMVATSTEDAREQWIATFSRARADLGPTHAAHRAAAEANRYALPRALTDALADLRDAWAVEATSLDRLNNLEDRRDLVREILPLRAEYDSAMPALDARCQRTGDALRDAQQRLAPLEQAVTAETTRGVEELLRRWDADRRLARAAAASVQGKVGLLGTGRAARRDARAQLQDWAEAWRPIVTNIPTDLNLVVQTATGFDDPRRLLDTFTQHARRRAHDNHPDYQPARAAAETAKQAWAVAYEARHEAQTYYQSRLDSYGSIAHIEDPADHLDQLEHTIAASRTQLEGARANIVALTSEPAIRSLPIGALEAERARWQHGLTTPRRADSSGRFSQPGRTRQRHHRAPDRSPGSSLARHLTRTTMTAGDRPTPTSPRGMTITSGPAHL